MAGGGIDDENGDDDQGDFDVDETDLESFTTVLESNEDIDEFQIFCRSLQRKSSFSLIIDFPFVFFE